MLSWHVLEKCWWSDKGKRDRSYREKRKMATQRHRNSVSLPILMNWVRWCSIQTRELTPQTTSAHLVCRDKTVAHSSVVTLTLNIKPACPFFSIPAKSHENKKNIIFSCKIYNWEVCCFLTVQFGPVGCTKAKREEDTNGEEERCGTEEGQGDRQSEREK